MALDADTLLDRIQLKQQLMRWRTLAIVALVLCGVILINRQVGESVVISDYVARVEINGVIEDNGYRIDRLNKLKNNNAVAAILVYINSPGGTAVGGEELYTTLKRISEVKPVVVLMRDLCASAGYMTAIGADYLIAREGTLTGSVGVIMQTIEATKLAESWGIEPVIIKSGDNKASPNPLEKFTPSRRAMAEKVVEDFYRFFFTLVVDERGLNEQQQELIRDGRVFTGRQALEAGLVDALGGETEALAWLEKEHDISSDTEVKYYSLVREKNSLFTTLNQSAEWLAKQTTKLPAGLDGLQAVWQPAWQ
jgi:protease-4